MTDAVAATRAEIGGLRLRAHFHNTRNTGYANALAAAEVGVTVLDASLGGIGGCPFAPTATGNIATEDLVYALHRSGYRTGVDLDAAIEASRWLSEQLDRTLPPTCPAPASSPPGSAERPPGGRRPISQRTTAWRHQLDRPEFTRGSLRGPPARRNVYLACAAVTHQDIRGALR